MIVVIYGLTLADDHNVVYDTQQILYSLQDNWEEYAIDSCIVGTTKLKKELLKSDGCFALDIGTELYLWIGKQVSNSMKQSSNEFFIVFLQIIVEGF
jgi:FixJ family two-component response regulator